MMAPPAMSNLLFWLGIGAAQKGAGSKPAERRPWVISFVVGILNAVLPKAKTSSPMLSAWPF
jgi:hypothetical protein